MGGALGLTSLADVGAAVEGTQFCFSEVKLGLAPAVISPFVLARMNHADARRYMLTGEIFDAGEAKKFRPCAICQATALPLKILSYVWCKPLVAMGPRQLRSAKQPRTRCFGWAGSGWLLELR